MTDAVEIALITAGSGVLVSIVGMLTIVIGKLNGVHRDMNSRFDQWMETVKVASYAEGVKSEQDRNKEDVDK